MGMFRRWVAVRFRRPGIDEGIDWEIQHHLQERVDELRVRGLGEDEARREALRSFGDEVRVRSELRRIDRGLRASERTREFLGTVWQDVRYAARGLVGNATFAVAVVLTLALGIGANGALFSVADALLLRPLPFAAPEELAQVLQTTPHAEQGMPYMAPPLAREWLADQTAVPSAFLHWRASATYTGGAEPATLPGLAVTEGFVETLGARPFLGRGFAPGDMVPGAPPVVVISHDFWSRALGGSPHALGTDIELNGVLHTVIGVMPRGFKFPVYSTTDIWLPLYDDDRYFGRAVPYVEILVRAEGGDFGRAEAAGSALAEALIRERQPDSEAAWRLDPLDRMRASSPELRQAMKLLGAAVALILLIAGVNMVNLLLLRGAARTREMAVRLALGASRRRLVRQLGTEAMLLALMSGVMAVFLALGALRVLQHIMPTSIDFWTPHAIELEGRTLLFTFGLAVLSGLVFGLLPALRATRVAGVEAGGGLASRTSPHPVGPAALRRALVTTEVALSVTLLVGAGLLIGSFLRLTQAEPGIDLERLAVLELSVAARDFPDAERRGAYLRLLEERIRGVPGVEATTMTGGLPPRGGALMFGVVLEGEGEEPRPLDGMLPTTGARADFFAVTGARLAAGRPFERGEDHDSGVVIINAGLASYLWPGRSAVGRRFRTGEHSPWLTVVGVTEGFRLLPPDHAQSDFALIHPLGADMGSETLAIRTAGDPRHVLQPVRAAVHGVNPRQVIGRLDTARSFYAESMDLQRFLYIVVTTLALLALALAAVGLYGLLAYGVARRQREIGVRLALGARSAHVRRLVVGEALALTAAGAVIGGAGALATSRFIEATLYGVEPTDTRTYLAVGAVIFGAAVLASLVPARRAARVDLAAVLRAD
jgi:putative ABC transport system permease protein